MSDTDRSDPVPLPRLPRLLLRVLVPPAEREEVLADLAAEHAGIVAAEGAAAARRWLWWQALQSAPALLGWSWWRGWSAWRPRANAYRPGGPMLHSWIVDARYAARRLRARPAYTLLAVLTLALGIGGTSAVFGVARPLLLEPLPYAHEREVGMLWLPGYWTEEEFTYMRGRWSGFRAVAGHKPGDVTMRVGDTPARLVPGLTVTAEIFGVLGARPLLGRGFQPGDDAQGAEPVVVVSHGLWQELGGRPDVVGSRVTLDGVARTVVGVMPRGFWFPDPAVRVWVPRAIDPQGRNGSYAFIGHVGPGEELGRMGPHLARIAATLDERFDYPSDSDKGKAGPLVPLREELLGRMRPALLATVAAMGLILLIACANVAALMLGQVEGRSAELAVRSALGANARRLTQQLVAEALLVGLLAGACGAAIAAAGFGLLARALPIGAWRESVTFGWPSFLAALGIAVATALLVALAPTASLLRGDLRGALHRARTAGVQGRGGRLERGLVVGEVALAMLIASGAALLVRRVGNLYAIDPGVDTRGIAVVEAVGSAELPTTERVVAAERMHAALAALPGVERAAMAARLPLRGGGDNFGIVIDGREVQPTTYTNFRIVSPEWFATMGIRLLDGRTFDGSDRDDAEEMTVVVNQALVDRYFPGENPIGRRLGGGFGKWERVVGIVEDVAETTLTGEMEPTRYYLPRQVPWFSARPAFALRLREGTNEAAVLEAARRTVQQVAPSYAVQEVTTMSRVHDAAVGPARQVMALLTLLSALALVLGAVGIYGVMSHFATRRRRDWAIRVALGLPGWRVVTHLVRQGTALVLLGVAAGAVGTAAMGRLLASLLHEVGAVDPLAFGAAALALLLVGAAAALVPAWRAGRVDPARVLREQ